MRSRTDSNVVHHVYRDANAPDTEYIITDSFFIKFKPDTSQERIRDFFQAESLVVEKNLGDLTYLVRVTNGTGRNPIRTANAACSRTDVEYAEPNLVRELTRFAVIPPDGLFQEQWHLHAPVAQGNDLLKGAGIFAADAWELTRGRRDIVVAVADDGFDLTHPDFQGEGKVAAQLNAIVNGSTIEWDADVHPRGAPNQFSSGDYHGTPCLGVAVAESNGTGTVGVAPNCSLVAVRFPLSMPDSHFVDMFKKISPIADVLSCSWGIGPANAPMSTTFRDTIATLSRTGGRRGKGLIFCVAAGNNNCPVQDLSNTRTYRYRRGGVVRSYSGPIDRWIAAHPDVITVSACTSLKRRSAYSSWGKQICVCAPSDNWDDLDEITPVGRGITTTDNESFGINTDFTAGSRFTNRFGGTSSATPTIAGVCGLVLSANPTLSASDVKQLLQVTADKDGLSLQSETPVNEPGDFDANGFSLWFGFGKVNALEAVKRALETIASDHLVTVEAQPGLQIPDVGSPVTSTLQIAAAGTIQELRISVDIAHTFIGDLRVDLIAPDGRVFVLHNNTGGSSHNLVQTYSALQTPVMQPLIGSNGNGTWQLRVSDQFRFDIGTLNSWRIAARLATPMPSIAAVPERKKRLAVGG
jgi:subtilisin-like proprotein convertase family protein/subtilisin family serine protease